MPIAGRTTGNVGATRDPACRTGKTNAPRNSAGGRPAFRTLYPGRHRRAGRRRHRSGRCASRRRKRAPRARRRLHPAVRGDRGRCEFRRTCCTAPTRTRCAIPASLTKIMTLYLLFEQIEAGKLRLNSRLEVSEHASQQAPSKLGLRPGPDHLGRGCDPRAGHQVGQRCRRRWSRKRSAATKRPSPA